MFVNDRQRYSKYLQSDIALKSVSRRQLHPVKSSTLNSLVTARKHNVEMRVLAMSNVWRCLDFANPVTKMKSIVGEQISLALYEDKMKRLKLEECLKIYNKLSFDR